MKTIILSILIAFVSLSSNAQNEEKNLKEYLEITMTDFSGSLRVDVGGKIDRFYIQNGIKYTFPSCIAAVHFFESQGWKLEYGRATAYNGGLARYYLMSRPISKENLDKKNEGVVSTMPE